MRGVSSILYSDALKFLPPARENRVEVTSVMALLQAFRMAPLQQPYKAIKLEHLSHWQKKKFKGYRSPWVPVAESNAPLVKTGALVIDSSGLQFPHQVGRDVALVQNGREVESVDVDWVFKAPVLAWVDHRSAGAEAFLRDNPLKEHYLEYSALMEEALRGAYSSGFRLVEDVSFPLFHNTDMEGAHNLLQNGICLQLALSREIDQFGKGFSAYTDQKRGTGLGNFSGARVAFRALEHQPARWLDRNRDKVTRLTEDLSKVLALRYFMTGGLYTWSVVCAELSASSFRSGKSVYIYDSFEEYVPDAVQYPQGK